MQTPQQTKSTHGSKIRSRISGKKQDNKGIAKINAAERVRPDNPK
jgi:hypothetical protein